jgi:hypothetical protein
MKWTRADCPAASGAIPRSKKPCLKNTGQPSRESYAEMSEYPRTGIDKAILKFTLQDHKKSQFVSVIISEFFPNFMRQMLPDSR